MSEARGAGRPRSAEKDAAILRAALELLASHGFVRMTLDQVAASAGVSKSTIHLRWRSKGNLVTAALESVRTAEAPAAVGDTRTDLVTVLKDFADTVEEVRGMSLIGTCLAEEAHNPELIDMLRQRTVLPRRGCCEKRSTVPATLVRSAPTRTSRLRSPRCSAPSMPTT